MVVFAFCNSKRAIDMYNILGGPFKYKYSNLTENQSRSFFQCKIFPNGSKYRGYLNTINDTLDGYGTAISPHGQI
jgi:hypothetical protein